MMTYLNLIDYNPHRDTDAYPIDKNQVNVLIESINQTGFWDNLLVREHPGDPNRYQLAYGHHRLEAALACGITKADIPVRDLSEDDMLHIMIKENATQAGGQSAAATLDSVKAILRRLAYLMLSYDFEHVGTIVPSLFSTNEKAFDIQKGLLLKGEGLGHKVIHGYDTSLKRRDIQASIAALKADGSLKEILIETEAIIEEEKVEAERIEAEQLALAEAERKEAEAATKRAEAAQRKADMARDEAEKARQERLAKDAKRESKRREKAKVQAEEKALQQQRQAKRAGIAVNSAKKASETAPVQVMGKGVAKYFDNSYQQNAFTDSITTNAAQKYIPIDQHEKIAKNIRNIVDTSNGEIRMSAELIKTEIQLIISSALGIGNKLTNEEERDKEINIARSALRNHLLSAKNHIELFSKCIKGAKITLTRYPNLIDGISTTGLLNTAKDARLQIDEFEKSIHDLNTAIEE